MRYPATLTQRLDALWFPPTPAERLAWVRILFAAFTLGYLLFWIGPVLLGLPGTDPFLFRPVGVLSPLVEPPSALLVQAVFLATLLAGTATLVGWRHRLTTPLFAVLLLCMLTYRNSWTMIFHTENLLVVHAVILALSPCADTLSLDARRRRKGRPEQDESGGPHWAYGWPLQLICAATLLTYFLAGVAKVAGPLGWEWPSGENLRDQVAVDALRKELLAGGAKPLAHLLYPYSALYTPLALGSLVIELAAPLVLLHRRVAQLWAAGAFGFHWGILAIMGIRFPYHLTGVVYASFFPLEKLGAAISAVRRRLTSAQSRTDLREPASERLQGRREIWQ